jgi:DNA-directed RNA polymerase subunit M/transcription elongation factor TFIIS
MSDFKIIKCKKCDAALVEVEGQKLNRCIQCGYNFNTSRTTKLSSQKLSSNNNQTQKNQQPAANFYDLFKRLQDQLANQTIQNDNAQKVPPVVSWILKAVKWYIIIVIAVTILSLILSY